MHEVTCPECGAPMQLKKTHKFKYGDGTPRLFYACTRFPACKGIHGAHPDGRPLGIPAKKEIKEFRVKAHDAFDQIWKSGSMTRKEAYAWLADQMGFPEVHIGEMMQAECEKVIAMCQKARNDERSRPGNENSPVEPPDIGTGSRA